MIQGDAIVPPDRTFDAMVVRDRPCFFQDSPNAIIISVKNPAASTAQVRGEIGSVPE